SMASPPPAWKFESVTDKGATQYKPTASTPTVVRDAFAASKATTAKFVADVKSGSIKVDETAAPATIPAAAGPVPAAAAKPAKDYTAIFKMDPARIRFSQDSISGQFKGDEGNVNTLAANLKSGTVSADKIPAIMLVERQGKIITLDNRRLYAFKQAGVEVRCRWATPDEVKNNSFKFTAGRLGKASIEVRL